MAISKYNLNILLVDDDKDVLEILEKSLSYIVGHISVASNGRDALEKYCNNDIDVIITDLSMPNMTGQELIANLKDMDDNLQIIVMSASSYDAEQVNSIIDLGVTKFLHKPINLNLLQKMLVEIFELKQLKQYRAHLDIVNQKLNQKILENIHDIEKKDSIIASQSKNVLMGEMFAMITHQLKQPLASSMMLVGGVKLKLDMQYTITNDEWYKYVELLLKNFEYFKETIEGFNLFYKNKNKGFVNLKSTIVQTIKLIEQTLTKDDINIIFNVDSEINIYLYENEFKQVLLNLVNNARDILTDKKTPNPTIEIVVNILNNNIILEVKDNANSLNTSIKDMIFDEHFTTKGDKGSGLGLYMTKMIIEKQFNGIVDVYSLDNKTIFRIEFPIH